MKKFIFLLAVFSLMAGCNAQAEPEEGKVEVIEIRDGVKTRITRDRVLKSEEEWKQILAPEEFKVARKKGTEKPYSGKTWDLHEKGIYQCVGCKNHLYHSDTKFESGTGWPSFWAPIAPENIKTEKDVSFFGVRTEIVCPVCDAHIGHVFEDGPQPTGLRYCMNSAAMHFEKEAKPAEIPAV